MTLRELSGTPIEAPAASRNPEDRIKLLDAQGVEACLNYPTLANLVEHSAAEDPRTHWRNHSFAESVDGRTLGGFHPSRSALYDARPDAGHRRQCLRELEFILENGAKVALIKPSAVYGYRGGWRSPALPEFDPFWREVEAAGSQS